MSRIAFVTIGTVGDVLPFVGIGIELLKRKHDVTIIANSYLAPAVRFSGFDFTGLKFVPISEPLSKKFASLLSYVNEPFFLYFLLSVSDEIYAQVNELRGDYDIMFFSHVFKDANTIMNHTFKYYTEYNKSTISLFPYWYKLSHNNIGFVLYNVSETYRISILKFLAKYNPIVISFSSLSVFNKSVLDALSLDFSDEHFIVIDKGYTGKIIQNVLYAPYIPYNLALSRCKAIVHHGGFGTTVHALKARIPQVILPSIVDQFYNAELVEKLGAGLVVNSISDVSDKLSKTLSIEVPSLKIEDKTIEVCNEIERRL